MALNTVLSTLSVSSVFNPTEAWFICILAGSRRGDKTEVGKVNPIYLKQPH